MPNLRITRIRVTSNTSFRVEFSAPLDDSINTSNVVIAPVLSSIPTPEILSVRVNDKLLDMMPRCAG